MKDAVKFILFVGVCYFIITRIFGNESGCSKYASEFSCKYVVEKATYDVFYTKDYLGTERRIGATVGLLNCKNIALGYSAQLNDEWDEHKYICVLVKDGNYLEKHRLLE